MKVVIDGPKPDAHALHSGHMLFDWFDLIVLFYVLMIVLCGMGCACSFFRLYRTRNDPSAFQESHDEKKIE